MRSGNQAAILHKWDPLSIKEVQSLLEGAGFAWWIAGGWAIDLFIGYQTRDHCDIDVLIRRDDQLALQNLLSTPPVQVHA